MSDDVVRSIEELRSIVGTPTPGVELKVYDHLEPEAREFIGRSPLVVMATSDRDGNLDVSPKGDGPGFVAIEDDRTLLVPDRPGNRLVFGLTNLLEQPHVSLLFVVPGTTETLRVTGRATITVDAEVLERLAARGRPAVVAIRVEVEECFFHCSKAFLRSELWKQETWPERQKVSFGSMIVRRLGSDDEDLVAQIDAGVDEDARTNL